MGSKQSLKAQLHSLLPQGDDDTDGKAIRTSLLKVINNTIVFDNAVYQIRNISSVKLVDLTRTYAINQTVPSWYWSLLVLGLILLAVGVGILILIFVAWLFWQHQNLEKSRTVERYGLRIRMNSGDGVTLTSSSKDFVLKIIVALYEIMNTEVPKAIAFNFETLMVEDKSINIDRAYGAAVISGQITGDVVNLV